MAKEVLTRKHLGLLAKLLNAFVGRQNSLYLKELVEISLPFFFFKKCINKENHPIIGSLVEQMLEKQLKEQVFDDGASLSTFQSFFPPAWGTEAAL